MDPQENDTLRQIVEKLDALQDHLHNLEDRLQSLEGEKLDVPPAVDTPTPVTPAPALPTSIPPLPTPAAPPSSIPASSPPAPTANATPPQLSTLNSQLSTQPARDHEFRQAIAGFRPDAVPPAKPKESWEVRIATFWLPRIGLLFLALVCILFAREYTQGPLGKVIGTYLAAIGLIAVGLWYEKKYPHWARPVMAGGLAFSYFASYAMGFVEPMRLLDSLTPKLIVLGVNLVLIFGVAHWKKSEVIGGTALILGYLTTGVVGNDVAAFSSSVALSIAALLFLWLNKWFIATALACAATYLAHFYVWRFVPEADTRTPHEAFWHHFMFLSLYFAVFSAAALTGKSAAHNQPEPDSSNLLTKSIDALTRRNLLTALTQVNVAAYVGGMIALLKLTGVYWDRAWLFFLPMAVAFAGLGLLFAGFATIQMIYLAAATLCLTLGIIAAASPMWLPVFLAVQALGMLASSRGRYAEFWQALSLIILGYACAHLVTNGQIDVLNLSTPSLVEFPFWTYAVVTAIALAYTVIWERRLAGITRGIAPVGHFLVAFAAAFVWAFSLRNQPAAQGFLYHTAAVPVVAALAVFARTRALAIFIYGVIVVAMINLPAYQALRHAENEFHLGLATVAIAGLAAGLLVEKRGTGDPSYDCWLWRPIYLWSQFLLGLSVIFALAPADETIVLSVIFAVTILLAWTVRSSAIGKSAYLLALLALATTTHKSPSLLACAAILVAATYPVALPAWRDRTGDTAPWQNRWAQAGVLVIAGIMVHMAAGSYNWNTTLLAGIWILFCSTYTLLGRFKHIVWIVQLWTLAAALFLLYRVGQETSLYRDLAGDQQTAAAASAGWSLLGVLFIVAAERVLSFAPNVRLPWANPTSDWLSPAYRSHVTSGLAIMTLIMAVMALRTLPDLRLFYFTGAMVAAAFVWIVFGFWFNEPVYRKSGFVLLCIGILKGLIWDVLSLKQTFYRIVSWSILGLLAIAASFLYTKFKGRLGEPEGE